MLPSLAVLLTLNKDEEKSSNVSASAAVWDSFGNGGSGFNVRFEVNLLFWAVVSGLVEQKKQAA